jgi:pimeloyl-ACP methyl ester carboxylesterase
MKLLSFFLVFLFASSGLGSTNEVYKTSVIDPFFYIGARIGLRSMAPAYDAQTKLKEKQALGLFKNFRLLNLKMSINQLPLNVEAITTLDSRLTGTGRRHVMFYYGVGGNIGRLLHEEQFLLELQKLLGPKTDISMIDYPGFGRSEGAANELTLIASAKQALSYFDREYQLGGESILLAHSLGSAVTLQVAAAMPQAFKAFVLLHPFYELSEAAGFAIVLTSDRYHSFKFAPQIQNQGFITGGVKDSLVKEQSSRKLARVFQPGVAQYLANPYDHVAPILEKGDLKAFQVIWAPILTFLNGLP